MFALECLRSAGETYENSEHVRRGCEFLLSKQREDGGWSESFQVSTEINKPLHYPYASIRYLKTNPFRAANK